MQRKQRPENNDEPAVTFELEEAPGERRHGRLGAAGTVAITGAGLASSGAASDSVESLDVFDQPDDPEGSTPSTSFDELDDTPVDPQFPAIDFTSTEDVSSESQASTADEVMYGATSGVGGGFVVDEATMDEPFSAPDPDLEPVVNMLSDDDLVDEHVHDEDDIDLS